MFGFIDSKLYVFWSGNPKYPKKPDSHIILLVVNYIIVLFFDLLTFHLYKKIEKFRSSQETKITREFDNILDIAKSKSFETFKALYIVV